MHVDGMPRGLYNASFVIQRRRSVPSEYVRPDPRCQLLAQS